jgi:hypothetical protein
MVAGGTMSIILIHGAADHISHDGTDEHAGDGAHHAVFCGTTAYRVPHGTTQDRTKHFAVGVSVVMPVVVITWIAILIIAAVPVFLIVFICIAIIISP